MVFHGNCLDVLGSIRSSTVDLVLVDPPYNIGFDSSKETHVFDEAWDHKPEEEFEQFNLNWLKECYRVLKPTGSLVSFMGTTQIPSYFSTIAKTDFINNLDNWEVLYRQKGRGSNHKLKSLAEDIVHLSKTDFYYKNTEEYVERIINHSKENKIPLGWVVDIDKAARIEYNGTGDVECFTQPYYLSKSQRMIHPCQKSIVLLAKLIMEYCPKKGVVLDCFMGSGSTGIAANFSTRNFIGIEQDDEMFAKAKNWLEHPNKPEIVKMIKQEGFIFGVA